MIIKPNIIKIYCEYIKQGVVADDWKEYEKFQQYVILASNFKGAKHE